jgi:hypothetical protein
MYAPLHKPEFRAVCCQKCLKVWATEAYDNGDEMPNYIEKIRAKEISSGNPTTPFATA